MEGIWPTMRVESQKRRLSTKSLYYMAWAAPESSSSQHLDETYWCYDLPFCRPDQVIKKEESLGEVLNGDRLTNAKYKLNFREDKDSESICKKTLSMEEVTKFRDAIKKDYYYQMYYDDLPLWGFVGKAEESMETMNETEPRYYLFNHIQFNVIFNQNQVIEISAFSDSSYVVNVDSAETEVEFMYSVRWGGTSVHFGNRMDKYLKSSLLPHHLELHWFSIINLVVIVVLLVGFLVTTFFRTIKNDMIMYSQKDQQEDKEEIGWKNVHGDVFRYPPYKSLLCGVLGTGVQLLILVLFIFVLAFMGAFYPHNRGAIFSSLFIVYALTSVVAGYTSSSLHTQWGGMIPIKNMLLILFLFPGPLFVIFSVLNTIAIIHNATAALSFGYHPNQKRSVKSETFDMQELADQLEIGPRFYVIGISMGAYAAWSCLKHIPTQDKARQQGDFESIHRDLMVGFSTWDFDPMDLSNPFPHKGSFHIWQGYEDKLVPFLLKR
ncbi:hypothetical protein MRB53_018206 [Persea americana]|uniref:Uncharacterized protein n=1 Tax=Persea americana TaxID=3435 RepID=A0ACC2M789_PERAE|nr:hypothetical protein MRB53_018206 [Persea americana]